MKKVNWGKTGVEVPSVVVGCMRIADVPMKQAVKLIHTALENGVNFFDHADIYGRGVCEEKFREAVQEAGISRDEIWIQSKCGIVPGTMYDFSKKHIIGSVEGSLKRLGTDHLDSLLLHRPDALMEPEEVAEAFDELETSGKVKYFGVSNHNSSQIELMKKYVRQPLVANQLQFGPAHAGMVRSGIEVNMMTDGAICRDDEVLNYCRLHDVTIQAWSPFQYGRIEGIFFGNEKYAELNAKIDEIAEKYHVSNTVVVTAWVLRHPARMQVLTGTMNPDRLEEICRAMDIELTREEWYAIYRSAGNILP